MKLIWSRRASLAKIAPHPQPHAVDGIALDFLRMIAAAVLSGLVISMAAAGLALLLARDADAASVTPAPASVQAAGPGVLLAGMGCDSLPLEAGERDWWVKIDGARATVRVMQSFLMPDAAEGAAVFQATLPLKADLVSLQVQTMQRDFEARVLPRARHEALDADEYKALTRDALIVSVDRRGELLSSLLPGLEEAQVVTVAYTYRVPIDTQRGMAQFSLPLTDLRTEDDGLPRVPGEESPREGARGSVWVEWIGNLPRKVDGAPASAHLEREGGRIEALAWESPTLAAGARLQLSWLR
ncbi:MAG: hypothetical protein JNK75_05780 [Betaproteobacteria bacterium]|nr:hypothetical protein [Betaproteobacteria bacterium]